MKFVFFGTPEYVVPIVDLINKRFRSGKEGAPVVAVVTQKPKPTGRKQIVSYSPVDDWAYRKGIPIYFSPSDLVDEDIKADIAILASYGQLIPKKVIEHFPLGIIVVHPSLLPQFRGASPVPAALVTGTNPTGVTFIKMDEKFDHGQIISFFKDDVQSSDTSESLRDRLFLRSAEILVEMLPAYAAGKIHFKTQDESKSSYARTLTKDDSYIPPRFLQCVVEGKEVKEEWPITFLGDYSVKPTPEFLERFIRAMLPWPGAWSRIKITGSQSDPALRIKLLKAQVDDNQLVLNTVQLEGKNEVSWDQFKQGYPNAEFAE